MVMLTHIPAQAEFLGTLHGDQPWTLSIDNSNNGVPAGMTIFYLGGKNVDFEIHTLQGAESLILTDLKIPRGTRRIIIELDPGRGLSTFALVTQWPVGFSGPGFESRLVIDVV
jgi:hypothetical protein